MIHKLLNLLGITTVSTKSIDDESYYRLIHSRNNLRVEKITKIKSIGFMDTSTGEFKCNINTRVDVVYDGKPNTQEAKNWL